MSHDYAYKISYIPAIVTGYSSVRLMPVLLQLLLELLRFPMSYLYGSDRRLISFLEFHGAVTNIFPYTRVSEKSYNPQERYTPSISFQALKKSSGSEKATKPYLACGRMC